MESFESTSNLCKGLRSCGLPKKQALELVNTIKKWENNNGIEWTIERLKSYKSWYESYIAGSVSPPVWFKKSNDNLPIGIFKNVFKIKNQARVFAILSASTVYVAKEVTSKQLLKEEKALAAEPLTKEESSLFLERITIRMFDGKSIPKISKFLSEVNPPGPEDITGDSIPVFPKTGRGKCIRRKKDLNPSDDKLQTLDMLAQSWRSLPAPTYKFLYDQELENQVPDAFVKDHWLGKDELSPLAGKLGLIQQPEFKGRWVANPNRVSQHYTLPLGRLWYSCLRNTPSDCTFNQESGIQWVQKKLSEGITLSGADMSSATDLLDAETSISAISKAYLGMNRLENGRFVQNFMDPNFSIADSLKYTDHISHFWGLSRSQWASREFGTPVQWRRGQPLGLYPSFALLGLTNNLLGAQAASENNLSIHDSFRVIGDDIIMDQRMLTSYISLVQGLGGEINTSKTLTSNRVAEFAGRIVTPTRSFLKTVKFKDMSDDSFMSVMSELGDQAKGLLKPRQRKAYENFKSVPGIIVDGPFMKADSSQIPLEYRYFWYLDQSGLNVEHLIPDSQDVSFSEVQRDMQIAIQVKGEKIDKLDRSITTRPMEDFQTSYSPRISGDPRRKDGISQLRHLEKATESSHYTPFKEYVEKEVKPKMVKKKSLLKKDETSLGLSSGEAIHEDESHSMDESKITPSDVSNEFNTHTPVEISKVVTETTPLTHGKTGKSRINRDIPFLAPKSVSDWELEYE